MEKIINWILNLFKSAPKIEPVVDKPASVMPSKPIDTPKDSVNGITLEIVQDMVVGELLKYVGAKEKGTNTDKGGIIDTIILSMGGKLGWPWCALTVCYCVTQTCKKLGISYPKGLYKGASSQGLKNESDKKYIFSTPRKGRAFVHTNPGDNSHGHTGLDLESADSKGLYDTVEGNSDNAIRQRADRSLSYAPIHVDVALAIFDQYKKEKGL